MDGISVADIDDMDGIIGFGLKYMGGNIFVTRLHFSSLAEKICGLICGFLALLYSTLAMCGIWDRKEGEMGGLLKVL